MKRLKDNSDVPEARLGAQKELKKEKDKATFYSPAEEWVLPVAEAKEPEDREWWIQEQVCIWSENDTLTLLSWIP